ncbi:MAG TPA: DUF6030 family protein [Bradyrhizobium sp.]|nr:DUF6030 family protein [Bradyrhizobium sp.]
MLLVVPVQDRHPPPEQQSVLPLPAKSDAHRPLRPGFLSARLDSPQAFLPVVGDEPERICDELDEAGFANSGWRGAEIAGIWECMSLFEAIDSGRNPTPANTVFYLLRGRASGRVNYARMKVNLPDAAEEAETLARAARFMEALSVSAGFDLPTDLQAAILAKAPISIVTRDVSFKLRPEFNDAARFNLSMEFGPSAYAFHRRPESGTARVKETATTLLKGRRERLRETE